jgi:hypothetical protein
MSRISAFTSQGPGNVGILTAKILLPEVVLQANTKPLFVKDEISVLSVPQCIEGVQHESSQHHHQPLRLHKSECTRLSQKAITFWLSQKAITFWLFHKAFRLW